jgi:AcrR family transcriptional regulator
VASKKSAPPAERKRRKPLDRERIEHAALVLVERDGLEAFSMRRLGKKLGVEAMSLYHHYPSKAHLFDALVDRLLSEIDAPDTTQPWKQRARSFSLAYRGVLLRYPRFAQLMLLHRMNSRRALAWLESVARIFKDAGFDAESGARAFRVLGYYLMGAIIDETAGYARGPSAAEPVPLAEQAAIAPTVVAFGPYFGREHWETTFLAGLELVLGELEQLKTAPAAHGTRSGAPERNS